MRGLIETINFKGARGLGVRRRQRSTIRTIVFASLVALLAGCAAHHDFVSGPADIATDPICVAAEDCNELVRSGSEDNTALLPWPPPAPTVFGEVTKLFNLRRPLGNISAQIDAKLKPRGYEKLRYFAIPGGFAVMTEVERLGARGHSVSDRWLVRKVGGWFGIYDYARGLIGIEDQHYRLAVIAIANQEVEPAQFEATNSDVERWKTYGGLSLNSKRAQLRAQPGTRAWVLIYEFVGDKSKGGKLTPEANGTMPLSAHLRSLGLQ